MHKTPWFHRKAWFLRKAWIDPETLFTRQEIAERTGLSDDVLSFWTKRGLLVAAEGGDGKGSHRRFRFGQVNIALLYAVFRDHFGANVATLSSLGEMLQRSVKTFERSPIYAGEWSLAANIGQDLRDFRNGVPVMVRVHEYADADYTRLDLSERMRKRPAMSEAEIIGAHMEVKPDESSPAAILRFAEAIGPGHKLEARIAQVLLGTVLAPTYMGQTSWLMRQSENGWEIREGGEDMNFSTIHDEEFGPAVFIPIGSMIQKVWAIPENALLNRILEGRKLESRLADFSIPATITPDENEEDGFRIEISSIYRDRAESVLNREGYTMPTLDTVKA